MSRMMRSMMEAAVNWIRAGLPLKCLKIVIYSVNPFHLNEEQMSIYEVFKEFKQKIEDAQQHLQVLAYI